MKRVVLITLGWSLAKPPDKQEEDKRLVAELLRRIGMKDKFDPDKHYYDLYLEVESEKSEILTREIQKNPDIGYLSRIDHQYTPQELESAELLVWGPTNQAIEDDYYDFYAEDEERRELYRRCPACGARLEQIREMIVNKALMRKKDVSLTYSDEVILSERVGQLLQEQGLTGFELRPVHHYKKPYKGEQPTLYQLRVTHVLPPMASPPTEFEHFHECAVCQRKSQFLKHTHWWGKIQYYEDTDVYYPRSVLKVVKDFDYTAEWFGEQRVMHRWIIITQRVYRLLREHKVKHWAAVPVCLVD